MLYHSKPGNSQEDSSVELLLLQHPAESEQKPTCSGETNTRLSGRWLILARVTWIILVAFAFVLLVASLPAISQPYSRIPAALHAVRLCQGNGQLSPCAEQHAFAQLGISLSAYMLWLMLLLQSFSFRRWSGCWSVCSWSGANLMIGWLAGLTSAYNSGE